MSNIVASNMKVVRKKKMIDKWKKPWLLKNFSSSLSQKMYGEKCGEYAYWCKGLKEFNIRQI